MIRKSNALWASSRTLALAFLAVVAPACVVAFEEPTDALEAVVAFDETGLAPTESLEALVVAAGPLRVNPNNSRYFIDPSGKTVYLVGSHTWANLQDSDFGVDPPPMFNYAGYLDMMQQRGHNFIRLWRLENPKTVSGRYTQPHPWMRSGPGTARDGKPKFDLDQFNAAYFQRLRDRVIAARDRNIYVSIMMFEGWWLQGDPGSFQYHPFNAANNVNGINGDPNGDGRGSEMQSWSTIPPSVLARQKAYMHKVIDTVNDLPNVLYEVANESGVTGTVPWQYELINDIKTYQNGKPKRHPVGMTTPAFSQTDNQVLWDSPADWISPAAASFDNPNAAYVINPPAAPGGKVSILDSDHIGWDIFVNDAIRTRAWVWKSFLRGHNPILMEDLRTTTGWQAGRSAMGNTRAYANKMSLQAMTPQGSRSTTGYCLSSAQEHLVYQPASGAFSLTLAAGTYAVEWFNPATGSATASAAVTVAAGARSFTPPFSGPAVLYLKYVPPATVPAAPSGLGATAVSNIAIDLAWADNSSNESGFRIERRTGTSGTYAQIATVGAGVRTYRNSGLAASTTYRYRVRAYNSAGTSGYSNEASATTTGSVSGALPQSQLRVSSATVPFASAQRMFDGNRDTRWLLDPPAFPQEFVVSLGGSYAVKGIDLYETWARIQNYELYVGAPGSWGAAVKTGTIASSGLYTATFTPKVGTHLRVVVTTSTNPGYCYISELNVLVN